MVIFNQTDKGGDFMGGKVFGILMNKGGVGKTSLATNLGALLAQRGKRVLIIDTDGQGNASLAFGKIPNNFAYTISDIFLDKLQLDGVTVTLFDNLNLDLVPANDDMNMLEFQVLTKLDKYPKPFKLLNSAIREAQEKYDYIFIDTPPAMGLVTGNVLSVTDELLIPFVPETFGVQGFVRVVEAVQEFEEEQGRSVKIGGVVGMMVDPRTKLHKEMMWQAKKYCKSNNIRLFDTLIPRSIQFANATAYEQKPVVLMDKKHPVHPVISAYQSLLNEVVR